MIHIVCSFFICFQLAFGDVRCHSLLMIRPLFSPKNVRSEFMLTYPIVLSSDKFSMAVTGTIIWLSLSMAVWRTYFSYFIVTGCYLLSRCFSGMHGVPSTFLLSVQGDWLEKYPGYILSVTDLFCYLWQKRSTCFFACRTMVWVCGLPYSNNWLFVPEDPEQLISGWKYWIAVRIDRYLLWCWSCSFCDHVRWSNTSYMNSIIRWIDSAHANFFNLWMLLDLRYAGGGFKSFCGSAGATVARFRIPTSGGALCVHARNLSVGILFRDHVNGHTKCRIFPCFSVEWGWWSCLSLSAVHKR